MRKWERDGYMVQEIEFDHDLHEFEIVKGGVVIGTITPANIDDMNRIIADLDAGEDVDGWEDGRGNTIVIPPDEVQFVVEAEKYFETDDEHLEQVKDGDLCLVTIDFKNQEADYIWYNPDEVGNIDGNPTDHPASEDDYEGVVQLWKELGRPQD